MFTYWKMLLSQVENGNGETNRFCSASTHKLYARYGFIIRDFIGKSMGEIFCNYLNAIHIFLDFWNIHTVPTSFCAMKRKKKQLTTANVYMWAPIG